MNNGRSTRRFEALLVLISVLVTLAVAEVAYRGWLHFRYTPAVGQSFYVYDKVNVQLDRDFGFAYIPKSEGVYIYVADGVPVSLVDMPANSLGNMGREPAGYDEAALKILIFGDSFTSIGHDGQTWTDILQDQLTRKLSRPVSVVNFGRDGYGILQMFDLAAVQVARFKPDYVIFAFISDDLTRARSWWLSDPGQTRLFRFESPPVRTDLAYAEEHGVDAALIDGRATKSWFAAMRARPDPSDPVLAALLARRQQLDKTKATPRQELRSWTSSVVYNRIIHGHPYGVARDGPARPRFRMGLEDFAEDARFMQGLATLNALGVPFDLVHLPVHGELEAGKFRLSGQEAALLESLSRVTGKEPISLLESPTGVDDRRTLFMLPDNHASAAGLGFFAESVSDILVRRKDW